MELVCNYALIRFLPYRETGEFVNIGLVIYVPEINYFDFRLAEMRNRRVSAFFPELERTVYAASVESLGRELRRQRDRFGGMAGLFGSDRAVQEGLTAFRSMLRRRESLLHFAEPGMKLGVPHEILQQLYADYVLRKFAQTPAYQEIVMGRRLKRWLKDWGIRKKYKTNKVVGDGMFHVTLPFVHFEREQPQIAIKPLDLQREDPTDVYEHGGLWVQRFRRLAERGQLPPRTVVPVLLPGGPALAAAKDVIRDMTEIAVQTADFNDADRLRELAQI
jgi:hypothetical protein